MEETVIEFCGHPAITALHARTFEVTKDVHLGPQGDCVIGVAATRACADLPASLQRFLRQPGARISLRIEVGAEAIECQAWGDPGLTFRSQHELVVRKSAFVCTRTLAVRATLAAAELPRAIIARLRNPQAQGRLVIRAQSE